MPKTEIDIKSEGFEGYFNYLMAGLTDTQRTEIPREIFHKVKSQNLKFAEMAAIMWKVFKKDIYIMVRDEEEGWTVEDFIQNEKELKTKNYGEKAVRDFVAQGKFVLGDDSICRGVHYQYLLSASNMFKFVIGARGADASKLANQRKGVAEYLKMILHYDNRKKEICRHLKITLAEMYILFYFFDGVEKKGSDIYLSIKFDAFGAGKSRTLTGLKKMVDMGYLNKRGKTRMSVYSITPLGMDVVYTCLTKYVLNY